VGGWGEGPHALKIGQEGGESEAVAVEDAEQEFSPRKAGVFWVGGGSC